MEHVPAFLFLALIVSALAGFCLQHKLLCRLKDHHKETWESMGSLTLFARNSPAASFAFVCFLLRGDFQKLTDPETVQQAAFLRIYTICYFLLFVTTIAAFILRAALRQTT